MSGISTNIYQKKHPNVGKYTIHGASGSQLHIVPAYPVIQWLILPGSSKIAHCRRQQLTGRLSGRLSGLQAQRAHRTLRFVTSSF